MLFLEGIMAVYICHNCKKSLDDELEDDSLELELDELLLDDELDELLRDELDELL